MQLVTRRFASGLGIVAAAISCSIAMAQERTFHLPQDKAVLAIPEFARQAGIQIIAPADQLASVVTPALQGTMEVRVALLKLLAGTPLEIVSYDGKVVVLRVKKAKEPVAVNSPEALQEVIVTATRRAERLQDVALSVSALSAAQLSDMGADSFAGFYRSVPGLTFNQSDPSTGSFVIRGINAGSGADNQATVGLYVDEFPTDDSRGARSLTDLSLFDVERVEILRGPQGTLFGSGALGGAIRVITNKPDPEKYGGAVEGDASAQAGGAGSYSIRGMVNIPLIDHRLALRAVAYNRDDGGYVDNVETGQTNVNGSRERGGRLMAKAWATDAFTLTATVVRQQTDLGQSGALTAIEAGRWVRQDAQPSGLHSTITTYNLVMDYNGPFGSVMSSTTYGDKDTRLVQGFDSGLLDLPLIVRGPDTSANFAQELRASSPNASDARLSWVAGLFYFKRKRNAISTFESPGAGALLGSPSDVLIDARIHMRDVEKAVYGELAYKLTEQLQATVGLRWFDNHEEYSDLQQGLLIGPPTLSGLLKNSESQATPKFVLAYKPTAAAMIYSSAAKGYRIGGTNVPNSADPAVPVTYKPDSLWNYEIGTKTSWLEQRLTVNSAVYYIDWKNIQIARTSSVTATGYVGNGGAVHSQGVEIEITGKPLRNLTLTSALSWNLAKSDQTIADAGILAGDRLPDARDFTASTTVEYTQPVAAQLAAFVRAEHQYVGRAFANFTNATAAVLEPYQLVNLRLGLERGSWSATLYAENLLNRQSLSYIVDSGNIAYRLRPRTFGFHFRVAL